MLSRFLGFLVLALCAAAGSDSLVGSAQSLPVSTYCISADQCAALCRRFVEGDQGPEDFIRKASLELGPPERFLIAPSNASTMPPVVDPTNVYSEVGANHFSPAVADALPRIYSPNLITGKVDVIDPQTFTVVDHFAAGASPQHIVPSWDLQTLWVTGDVSGPGAHGSLVPIDPKTGKPGTPVKVDDAYNMYFTPDGRSAIVVAEAMRRLEFRDSHTMDLQGYINAPQCAGINHADFAIDGSYAIFTCEFNNALVKIDMVKHELIGTLQLAPGHMPQDIRISPDGSVFFVADMIGDGVVVVNGETFKEIAFIPTGVGTHGLYPSRDGKRLYVSNRGTHNLAGIKRGPGSISVIDFKSREVVANWPIPDGGSPDMGNVSADGQTLWLSARYDGAVYAINTTDGSVKTIPVGGMPHGLTVWPQPGRYSLGHTGNMR
ncbi:YncE family protein [Methylocapsa sp. S129]|uniref:YncE family protein n=1 Tax=Methylocapsa sp. S129 TaxID=1641869 RepID=UPI001AEEE0D6|nr:YncE family protein [Methylocapsa sp. S129]